MSISLKIYKHKNRNFEVHAPKDCRILIKCKGLPYGQIFVREETGSFHESVLNVGDDCDDLKTALSRVCDRMIKFARQKDGDKCRALREFFDRL